MKKICSLIFFIPMLLASCGGNEKSSEYITTSSSSSSIEDSIVIPETGPFAGEEFDYYGFDNEDNNLQMTLKCQNSTSVAYSSISGEYRKDGIVFYLKFKDSDIYSHNIYDIGYDDNVEIIFNTRTDSHSWVVNGSYHFLINAEGETYFQVASRGSSFGVNLDPNMGVVPGENYVIDFHKCTDEVDDFNGFAARIFFAYDLLQTTYENALGDICVCLGMRNTHCFDIDSVWKSYSSRGCRWSDASTFVNLNESNEFVS